MRDKTQGTTVMGTLFYAVRIKNREMSEITEYLAMNGYTYDTNGENVLFVCAEEIEYVMTILDDHGVEYEVI